MKRFLQKLLLETGLLFFIPALAAPKGMVECSLEWGSSRQTHTVVFSGMVTCRDRPCSNATIDLELSPSDAAETTGTTTASANGSYLLQVSWPSSPDESARWRLIARAPLANADEAVEVEGRALFTADQDTVLVQRPLHLVPG